MLRCIQRQASHQLVGVRSLSSHRSRRRRSRTDAAMSWRKSNKPATKERDIVVDAPPPKFAPEIEEAHLAACEAGEAT